MLTNIKNEEKEEAKNFDSFQTWCESEASDFQKVLEKAVLSRDQNGVSEKEYEATIAKLENDLGVIQKEEQETRDALAQEEEIDKEDDKKYDEDMTMNTQATSQVKKAIKIVGKVHEQGGFLQNGVLTRLQLNEPGESSYVLGIVKQLRKTLADTRTKMMSSQSVQEENSEALVQTKRQQLDALAQEKSGKKQLLTQARVDLEEAKADLNRALKKIPEVEKRIQDTKAHCEAKEKAWKVRKADRKAEEAAIKEAMGYLQQSGMDKAVAAVVGESSQPWQSFGSGQGSREEMPALVQVEATKNSLASRAARAGSLARLSALAEQQSGDDVKKVVNDMASALKQQQKDEEMLVATCKSSLETKDGEVAQNKDDIAKLTASVNLKAAEITSLSAEASELKKALTGLQANLDGAAALRKEEHKMYKSQSKDRKLSIKVIKQAAEVLKKFYATKDITALARVGQQAPASALQLGEELVVVDSSEAPNGGSSSGKLSSPMAPPKTFSGSTRKSLAGAAVMKLLEKLREDMTAEQRTADKEESDAVAAFEQLQKDSRDQFDQSMSEITERMKRKATITVQMSSDKQDKSGVEEELGTVQDQLKALHKKCDEVMKSIKDRTKSRDFELSQLRDVLDILAGSQLAVRTGA